MNDDFLPSAKIDVLEQRAGVLRQLRRFFDDRGFFEVETPLISHDIVVDRHLHPVGIPKNQITGVDSNSNEMLWLQTSPEFGMKRLVASGATAIYQIGKAFRQSETGGMHNPEFTMLEWYRVGDNLETGMALLAELVEVTLKIPKTERVTYREIFQQHVGVDPFSCAVDDLKSVALQHGIEIEMSCEASSRDEWLNLILSRLIEPKLGIDGGTIIYDWPASQSALAVVRQEEIPVAERFEIYVNGVELANGYHELLAADELARRNSIVNQQRVKDGQPLLPEESRLLQAMRSGLPACAGVAVGVDRLVMLALGLKEIKDVIAFPIDRA
ncbi:MAG: elongation factor P--(R)-beta-lysine ligase [Mariniblastus sp.]|nr:elongation factor P--(R)-beta-lysine ligase [Mariniblastus sp.]